MPREKEVVKETMSIGGWLLVAILAIISIVNMITFLALAFSVDLTGV
ncbi:hypothetical protein MM221_07830 [Salipaludibacillus sp. LMS25]|jgi:hypothetical protein|nr:hypothetical protein [Salipaludibacillus sp. LMS25]UTR16440.1 hypothetical protein MM221_07830 [Salipaludibacillus sp. LMS25]